MKSLAFLLNPSGEPKEPDEKEEDVIVQRVPIDLEDEDHEAPEDSERPLETVSSFISDVAGNDHVEHAVDGQVEQHEECQSVIFDGRVLMVEEDSNSNADALSDRLSKLARRLNDLKRTSPTDNEDVSSFHGPGPMPCRLAVRGTSRSWTSANQQVRGLAGLQSLWPETPVRALAPGTTGPLDLRQNMSSWHNWNFKKHSKRTRSRRRFSTGSFWRFEVGP